MAETADVAVIGGMVGAATARAVAARAGGTAPFTESGFPAVIPPDPAGALHRNAKRLRERGGDMRAIGPVGRQAVPAARSAVDHGTPSQVGLRLT